MRSCREIVRDVKEKETFYIALDYDTELRSTSESSDRENTYEFPDGNIITVGAERFRCAEVLFQPSFIGKEGSRIHDTSFLSRFCTVASPYSKGVVSIRRRSAT